MNLWSTTTTWYYSLPWRGYRGRVHWGGRECSLHLRSRELHSPPGQTGPEQRRSSWPWSRSPGSVCSPGTENCSPGRLRLKGWGWWGLLLHCWQGRGESRETRQSVEMYNSLKSGVEFWHRPCWMSQRNLFVLDNRWYTLFEKNLFVPRKLKRTRRKNKAIICLDWLN